MKMVLAMLLVFILTGALIERISRWILVGMTMAILGILLLTRLTF